MHNLLQDLRYAARMLRKAPGFTTVAVLTLALGIGANAAMFAVLDAALVRDLPVHKPGELYIIQAGNAEGTYSDFSYPLYQDYRDRTDVFSGVFGYTIGSFGISTAGSTERVIGEYASAGYFDILGVRPVLGSSYGADDERAGNLAAVISHGLWQRAFGGERDVIGKSFTLNGRSAVVVGVAPKGFSGMVRGYAPELWLPLSAFAAFSRGGDERLGSRNFSWLALAGRLKPGVNPQVAAERLTAVSRTFDPQNAAPPDYRVVLVGASRGDTGAVETFERPLTLLMAAVGLILAIACANLANLLLARSGARQREIAVRRALGATRGRLVQQLLTESLLLAVVGAGLGLVVAGWGAELASTLRNEAGSRVALGVSLDVRVLLFTAVIALLTALLFGILPALRASSPDLVPALKDATHTTPRRVWLKDALAVAQVALSLVLLVGAGLFLRSLWQLQRVGSEAAGQDAVALSVNLGLLGYTPERGAQFYTQAIEKIQQSPGIEAASFAFVLPVTSGGMRQNLNPRATLPALDSKVEFDMNPVAPRFFETVGLPLLRGRDFRASDREGAPKVIIVNETFARRFWPDRDPIGQRFATLQADSGAIRDSFEVVGVARDSKYRNLREQPRMVMYLPLAQSYEASGNLLVRSAGGPEMAAAAVREAMRALDPQMPVYNLRTLREHINNSVYLDRLKAGLLTLFGLLALVLAAIGVYGLLSYNVVNRTREIGIRMALGAQRGDVLGLVLGGGLRLAVIGLVLGLLASFWLSRLVASQLFQVSGSDPATLAAAAALLLGMALLASYIPARRAARVDPMVALRYE